MISLGEDVMGGDPNSLRGNSGISRSMATRVSQVSVEGSMLSDCFLHYVGLDRPHPPPWGAIAGQGARNVLKDELIEVP